MRPIPKAIMLIFHDRRLVFLATPKAGSSAVEAALESLAAVAVQRPAALKHTTAAQFDRHVRPWLEAVSPGPRFATVALMREPVDWLRSWYRFSMQDDRDDPDHPLAALDFAGFAQAAVSPEPPAFARIGRQSDFLASDGARVDHIFRYEDMTRFTHFLEDRLDCAISLPRVNVPPSVDVSLTAQTERRLRAALAADLDLYTGL